MRHGVEIRSQPDYMPMYDKLSNPEEWLNDKESEESDEPMFADYLHFWPIGFEGSRADSLRFATMAMRDYLLMVRDIGLEYQTPVTSRMDISTWWTCCGKYQNLCSRTSAG